jgi:hypothetical protein
MEFSTKTKDIASDFIDDFATTLNNSKDCLTEISFADKGSSAFNRAIYTDKIESGFLKEISLRECNIAFLADCAKDTINAPLHQTVFRQAKNESIRMKSIISFDIDFKTMKSDFLSMDLSSKFNFAISLAENIVEKTRKNNIPVWIINYSGNGLHIHFKLNNLIHIVDKHEYTSQYKQWTDVLALALGSGIMFDTNCSNVARLMRLPLST